MPITCFLEKGPLDGGVYEMDDCYLILRFPPVPAEPGKNEPHKQPLYELNYYNQLEAQATYFFYGYDD